MGEGKHGSGCGEWRRDAEAEGRCQGRRVDGCGLSNGSRAQLTPSMCIVVNVLRRQRQWKDDGSEF